MKPLIVIHWDGVRYHIYFDDAQLHFSTHSQPSAGITVLSQSLEVAVGLDGEEQAFFFFFFVFLSLGNIFQSANLV